MAQNSGWKSGFKGQVTDLDTATAGASGELGEYRQESGVLYQYVKNGSTTVNSAGVACVLKAAATDATVVHTANVDDFIFGVAKAEIPVSGFGFVVKQGIANIKMGSGSCEAGNVLTVDASGTFLRQSTINTGSTTGFLGNVQVRAIDAILSGATGSAYISV